MFHKQASDMMLAASDLLPTASMIPFRRVRANEQKAAETTKITKTNLSKLLCPIGRAEIIYWDKELPRLGLRVYPSGRQSWVVQYRDANARTRRTAIGQAMIIDPGAARKIARKLLARVANGANPSLERKAARKAQVVADLVEAYLAHAEGEQRS